MMRNSVKNGDIDSKHGCDEELLRDERAAAQSALSLRDSLFATGVYQPYIAIPQDEPIDEDELLGDTHHRQDERPCSLYDMVYPDVEAATFNIIVGCVIVINAIVLGLETDLGDKHFVPFEHIFNSFFTYEMILRLCQNGIRGYFEHFSNVFDCILVCTGDYDLWIHPMLMALQGNAEGADHGSAKFLKLLRMFRVMRIVRLFKMFRQLQIILEAFMKALSTVMWVGLLTVILNYVCAVFLTQTLGQNAAMWEDKEEKISLWFGTIGRSIRTLFIVITLAEWDEIALTIAERVNGMAVFALAMAYITITAFTMVSLITGIISEELVRAQADEKDHKAIIIDRGRSKLADDVVDTLKLFDDDQSGTLSPDEVLRALHSPQLKLTEKLKLLQIDLNEHDLQEMIEKLKCAFGSPEVNIGELADAVKQRAGNASASKLWDLKMIILQLRVQLKEGMNKVYRRLDALESHSGAHPKVQADSVMSGEILTNICKRLDVLEGSKAGKTSEKLNSVCKQPCALEAPRSEKVGGRHQTADLLPHTDSFDEFDEFHPFRDTRISNKKPEQLSMSSAGQQLANGLSEPKLKPARSDGLSEPKLRPAGVDLPDVPTPAATNCGSSGVSQRSGAAGVHDVRLGSFESLTTFESLERVVGESSQRLESLRCRLESTEAEVRSSSAQTNAMFQEMMSRMSQILERNDECSKLGSTVQRMAQVVDRNESFHAELLALLRNAETPSEDPKPGG